MGSVRQRLSEPRHDCNVVLAGDCRVGKTALVNRFVHAKFSETYKATSFEKLTTSGLVANRRVKYTIWDTTGSHSSSPTATRTLAYQEADVFLLCYKIADPNTLFSALNHWCPAIRAEAPSTPIILVGCQSDLRNHRDQLAHLAKQGKAPVSSDQALSFSQQIAAQMYVETSAKASTRAAVSAFEVAALASMGKLGQERDVERRPTRMAAPAAAGQSPRSTPSPKATNNKKQKFSTSPANSLERDGATAEDPTLLQLESAEQFWDQFNQFQSPKLCRSHSEAPKTPSLSSSSRSASLSSKTRSSISIPASITSSCISGNSAGGGGNTTTSCGFISSSFKTPKTSRKASAKGAGTPGTAEKMITIKCQRLTADKTYEEIEVEVPAPIYETIQLYNDTGSLSARSKERKSFGSKLKNLFSSSKN